VPARSVRRANAFLDERLNSQHFLKTALAHIFPDNWSFMLGELAMYCLLLLIASGTYLALYFDPSDTIVTYQGPYLPMHGVQMNSAYESMLYLDLQVRAGNFFRQMHHWAALIFLAAISVHLMRIFFTGAYRKPRDINWMVGLTLLLLSMVNGFTGYSLPGDLLSGLGLRIAYTITQSVPVLGNWMAYLIWGGQFPSDQVEHRLFIAHVFIVPILLVGLLGLHLSLIWRQKHTQFPGRGRSEKRLVGSQMWPTYTFRSAALMCFTVGAISLLAGVVQINPVWLYGPYRPDQATIFAQPDWYVGFLEGTLRLFPGWRLHLWGYTVSEAFWPAVFFPLLCVAIMYAWPALERFLTGDMFTHNLLDRPRDRPGRTAFGVYAVTLYIVLFFAGGQDFLAYAMALPQTTVTLTLRGLAILLPFITAGIAWKVCRDLSRAGRLPLTEPPEGDEMGATPPVERYMTSRAGRKPGGTLAGQKPGDTVGQEDA
jgi:ubiquinol-cytochrome c reductase cytochrome b subunit